MTATPSAVGRTRSAAPARSPQGAANPWREKFLRFCSALRIPSKDQGIVPLVLMPTQVYVIDEVFAGLAEGIHDFVIVKTRQVGVSTVLWALDLFWLMTHGGLQGLYLVDSDPNKELHRDVMTQMYASLPPSFSRGLPRVSNRLQLAFRDAPGYVGSRLMFSAANLRAEGQLGRSRGINYVHADEVDGYQDREGVAALAAALSDAHPDRLYIWAGTGQGYGLLYEMWEQAESSVTSRRLFIGFWRRPDYSITRDQRALWAVYGAPRPTPDETEWITEVQRRYDVAITREQLAWWRWKKAEGKGINGDEATMLQEYPWLPEQAFQASGSQFLSASTCLRVRTSLERAPQPTYWRYDWGPTFDAKGDDALVEVPKEAADLTVWEQPQEGVTYLVAGDPAFGSSEKADRHAVTVWRCHPDALVQVAEFCTPEGPVYTFAWVLMHLAGNYPRFLIHETNGPGIAVLQEIERCASYGFGLTTRHGALQHVVGAIQSYLWRKADTLSGQYARQWKTGPSTKPSLMEKLRDTVERGCLVVRSPDLATELAALRREGDIIEAGGVAHDDLAITAALAVECWTEAVIPEIEDLVAPHLASLGTPANPTERLIRSFMQRLQQPPETPKPVYGIAMRGPGR